MKITPATEKSMATIEFTVEEEAQAEKMVADFFRCAYQSRSRKSQETCMVPISKSNEKIMK